MRATTLVTPIKTAKTNAPQYLCGVCAQKTVESYICFGWGVTVIPL